MKGKASKRITRKCCCGHFALSGSEFCYRCKELKRLQDFEINIKKDSPKKYPFHVKMLSSSFHADLDIANYFLNLMDNHATVLHITISSNRTGKEVSKYPFTISIDYSEFNCTYTAAKEFKELIQKYYNITIVYISLNHSP